MPRKKQQPQRLPDFLQDTILADPFTWSGLYDALNDPRHPKQGDVRAVVDLLIEKGGPSEDALEEFYRRFEDPPTPPLVMDTILGTDEPIIVEDVNPHQSNIVLRKLLLSPASVRRVKRCPECGRYFFDTTKRNNAIYNTRQCASRARKRRFRAVHTEPTATP